MIAKIMEMYRLKKMDKLGIHALRAILISINFLIACSCTPNSSGKAEPFEKFFNMDVSGIPFCAQIAITDGEKAQGLMFREKLGENESMLFAYDAPRRVSFWMKNTSINLDLGLFDSNGMLLEVKSLYPHNLNPVNSSSDKIKYCLEISAGWFAKNGLHPGAKLNMKLLGDAINARKGK